MCLNNIVSILNRAYVKKTDDINRLNRVRLHTDGEYYKVEKVIKLFDGRESGSSQILCSYLTRH